MDALKNFAYGIVATAPSPATSGTSLVLQSGQGASFPVAPFDVTIWPAGVIPLGSNAEIARCTAITTDTLTITRGQYGTTAQSVAIGYQVCQAINTNLIAQLVAATAAAGLADVVLSGGLLSLVGTTNVEAIIRAQTLALPQIFTTSGTWTPSSTGQGIFAALVVGGGGGGAAGGSSTGGIGGGGGEVLPFFYLGNVTSPQTVTIGAGGTSGAIGSGTSIGSLVTAQPGSGGTTAFLNGWAGDGTGTAALSAVASSGAGGLGAATSGTGGKGGPGTRRYGIGGGGGGGPTSGAGGTSGGPGGTAAAGGTGAALGGGGGGAAGVAGTNGSAGVAGHGATALANTGDGGGGGGAGTTPGAASAGGSGIVIVFQIA